MDIWTFHKIRRVKIYLLQTQTLRGPFDCSKVWPDSGCWRAVLSHLTGFTHDHWSDSFGDLCQGKPCHGWGLWHMELARTAFQSKCEHEYIFTMSSFQVWRADPYASWYRSKSLTFSRLRTKSAAAFDMAYVKLKLETVEGSAVGSSSLLSRLEALKQSFAKQYRSSKNIYPSYTSRPCYAVSTLMLFISFYLV